MSSWTGFGSACADPIAEASPARGQSSVGNVGGAGSREPLQGRDGVCRRVSHVSARIWAQEFCGILRDMQAICSVAGH